MSGNYVCKHPPSSWRGVKKPPTWIKCYDGRRQKEALKRYLRAGALKEQTNARSIQMHIVVIQSDNQDPHVFFSHGKQGCERYESQLDYRI